MIEALCQGRGKPIGPEFIKYDVYYADEMSEDSFAAARDALTDLADWDEFKCAVREVYPQYEVVQAPMALPAPLPLLPVPSASPPSALMSAATVMLAADALQALLLPCFCPVPR